VPALIVLAIVATFGPVCGHEFTNWDDKLNVTHNPHLNPPTMAGLASFWRQAYEHEYIPLSYTAWWLLARVARVDTPDAAGIWLNPYIFHIANLLLHIGVCLVVYQLLRLLTGRHWAACGGALLFALHPLQVEAVAWVTGLKDLLCGLLSMIALWQYVLFARGTSAGMAADDHAAAGTARRWHYAAATVALMAAMLAKPSAVTVPIIAIAIDWLILRRHWRRVAVAIVPWVFISAAFTAIGILAQPVSAADAGPVWARPLIAADALAFYLGKLLLPIHLAAVYPHSEQQVLASPLISLTGLVPVALGVIAWAFRRRAPWFAAAAIIFVAGVLPVLGLVPFEFERISTVSDRYVYVGMLGPSLAIAFVLAWLQSRQLPRMSRWVGAGFAGGLAALAVLSARQERYWHDSTTLFTRVLELDPRNDVAYCNLAADALEYGRPDQAAVFARRAVELYPARPSNGITLGIALQRLGRHAEAAAEFLKVVKANPSNVVALTNLASELALGGHVEAAIGLCRNAIRLEPQFPDAHRMLATLLLGQHKNGEALPEAAEAVRLDPSVAANHLTYGKVLAATGRQADAEQQFAIAHAIDPGELDASQAPGVVDSPPH
jgi:Tfp pilus assembly protein PilF